MNRKRNLILFILTFVHLAVWIAVALLAVAISLHKDNVIHSVFVQAMAFTLGGIWIIIMALNGTAILYSRAKYDSQFIKHQDNLILENKKKEIRGLIIAGVISFTGLSVFIMLYIYLRSGLTKNQLRAAKKQIALTNVNLILDQPAINEKINARPELKRKIKSLGSIREKGIDTPHHVNSYIMKLLREEGINFRFPYNDREIYYAGMAYKR